MGISDLVTKHATTAPAVKLRTGRHLGRTLYLQVSDHPTDSDRFLGILDSPEIATLIMVEINRNPWLLNEIAIECGLDGDPQ